MNTRIVKLKGQGNGNGESAEILTRLEIEKIISEIDPCEVFEKALEGYIRGMKNGICELNLVSGELRSTSLGTGESNQICDDIVVEIFQLNMDENVTDGENPYIFPEFENVWQYSDSKMNTTRISVCSENEFKNLDAEEKKELEKSFEEYQDYFSGEKNNDTIRESVEDEIQNDYFLTQRLEFWDECEKDYNSSCEL
jgi:hypothetical protein